MAGRGQPPFAPTQEQREQVRLLVCCGTKQDLIARVMRFSVDTLDKHFREELDGGLTEANAAVAGTLYQKALAGDTVSCIFWLKTRARWREAREELLPAPLEDLSPEEISGLIAALKDAAAAQAPAGRAGEEKGRKPAH